MKEIKVFFGNDNKLNKGYFRSSNDYNIDDKSLLQKKFAHILPPIDVVTEFENVYPGTLSRIIDMAEKEQHHRHALDLIMMEARKRSIKMGRICAILIVIIACITTVALAIAGHHIIGLITNLIIFSIIGIISYTPIRKFKSRNETEKSISPKKTFTSSQTNISSNSQLLNHGAKLNNNRNRRRIK